MNESTKLRLIILRGLPGSGKSHYIETELPSSAVVCSADHFFEDITKNYVFNPANLAEAHAMCQCKALTAMANNEPLVVIDNTNSRLWEFGIYKTMAITFGYDMEIKNIGGRSYEDVRRFHKRNKHGVPEEAILKMAYRWEKLGEEVESQESGFYSW